jgi:hypothetical protein
MQLIAAQLSPSAKLRFLEIIQAIMKFTCHTSERNFLKYLKLDAELTAQKYKNYF